MDGLESKNKAKSLSCAMDFYYNFREIGQIELKLLWGKTIVFFRLATRLSYYITTIKICTSVGFISYCASFK